MSSSPPKRKSVSVVPAFDNVQKSTRWSPVRVIINHEESSKVIDGKVERVPESSGPPDQTRSIRLDSKDTAPFASSRDSISIGGNQIVGLPEIFTETKINPSEQIEGESGQAVVWIISLGFQVCDFLAFIGLSVAIRIAQSKHLSSCGHKQRPVRSQLEIHGRRGPFVKRGDLFGDPVSIAVPKDSNTIGLRSLIIIGSEMGMAFDDEDSTIRGHIETRRCHQRGFGCETLDVHLTVDRLRIRFLTQCQCGWAERPDDQDRDCGSQ